MVGNSRQWAAAIDGGWWVAVTSGWQSMGDNNEQRVVVASGQLTGNGRLVKGRNLETMDGEEKGF